MRIIWSVQIGKFKYQSKCLTGIINSGVKDCDDYYIGQTKKETV